jgi:AraC-like DNA-binding protein
MQLKKEDLEKAKQIKIFLENNYQEHYDYAYLIKKFGMNMFNLKQAFKAVTNENVHAFLTRIRIDHAKLMLLNTDLSVESIAIRVGLDKSNFHIQFKKITGKTPNQWRKDPTPAFTLLYHDPLHQKQKPDSDRQKRTG